MDESAKNMHVYHFEKSLHMMLMAMDMAKQLSTEKNL